MCAIYWYIDIKFTIVIAIEKHLNHDSRVCAWFDANTATAKFVSNGVSMLGVSKYISIHTAKYIWLSNTSLKTRDHPICLVDYSIMNFKSISSNNFYRDIYPIVIDDSWLCLVIHTPNSLVTSHPSQQVSDDCMAFIGAPIYFHDGHE